MNVSWISFIAGIIIASCIAWLIHTVDVDRLKQKQQTAISDQKEADAKACVKDQQVTKEANDALQKNNDSCTQRLTERLRKPAACVPVASSSKLAPAGRNRSGAANGLSDQWLHAFAEQCRSYKQTLRVCETYSSQAHDACMQ